MKSKHIQAYMQTADAFAACSTAVRAKVGAILVKDDRIISIGYNGTPIGADNVCEDVLDDGNLRTKSEVLHAETNCLAKVARSSESSDGAVMFVTLSPCFDCSKLIYQAGIKKVYYRAQYRNTDGIDFLKKFGVDVEQYDV